MRYEIIGDYPAPSFFNIKEDDGQITVSQMILRVITSNQQNINVCIGCNVL